MNVGVLFKNLEHCKEHTLVSLVMTTVNGLHQHEASALEITVMQNYSN